MLELEVYAAGVRDLNKILELDQELSKGWSTYAPRLRKALIQAQMQQESSQGSPR